jgi:hypothetical protein
VLLQGVESIHPEPPVAIEPPVDLAQGPRVETVDTLAAAGLHSDQARLAQDAQVPRD